MTNDDQPHRNKIVGQTITKKRKPSDSTNFIEPFATENGWEKGSPPPPLAVSAELSSCGSYEWRSLSLEATGHMFVVRTEFLMLNRGGEIMMFLSHNGAIKLRECVFICLRALKGGGSKCTHDLYEVRDAGQREKA